MNTKSKVLIGLMALCLLGGVGSTLALTRSGAAATGNPGAFDKAIYLYWGHEETSVTIAPVQNLQPSVAQYRGLTVSPQSTKSLTGNVQLTFALAASEGNHHIKGLAINVYPLEAALDEENAETQIGSTFAAATLNEANPTQLINIGISSSGATHETVKYYAIKVTWSGVNDPEHTDYTLDASLTISQSFVA